MGKRVFLIHWHQHVKATRDVPLIFVGGEGEALRKTQDAVPDALYVEPQGLPAALEKAMPV